MKKLTTKQLLAATGIKAARTIQRWRDKGLVPPPLLQLHPNGRGMSWAWPAWTVFHVKSIKNRLENGETLDQISRTLSGDWDVEAKKWIRKRPDLKAMYQRELRWDARVQLADLVSDVVYEFFRDIGIERPGRVDMKIWNAIAKCTFGDELMKLLRDGYSPVILVVKTSVEVVPDFIVSSAIARAEAEAQPILAIPIREAAIAAFAQVIPDMPRESKFKSAHVAEEQGGRSARLRKYRHNSMWEFAFDK